MPPPLRVYDYIAHPYDRVREVFEDDALGAFQRATAAAGARAEDLHAQLHARFGPIDLTADIDIEIGPFDDTAQESGRPALRIPLRWRAKRTPIAFPVMQAELAVYPLTPSETQLELAGSYEPPLGFVGRVIDGVVLHRIAEASVRQFIEDLRRHLDTALRAAANTRAG
jgi:hypothetical protein